MNILCVSDTVVPDLYTRMDKKKFKDIDLILACGDLPPEYLSFLFNTLEVPLFYVRGNHDLRYESSPPMGCVDIHARIVRFRGIKLMGLEGSRWYNGGPNQYRENQMKWIVRKMTIPLWWHKGVDIIVTHAPPLDIHDAEDRCHRGFATFRNLIDTCRPDFFIHGHIHQHFATREERETVVNTTRVINAYGYTIISIDNPPTT